MDVQIEPASPRCIESKQSSLLAFMLFIETNVVNLLVGFVDISLPG